MLRFTCLLLLATPLAAQSPILVDAAGGPGHH